MATVPKDMMDVIHAMNGDGSTERVPMLSDEQLKFFTAKDVRDYYENLITTGKLRVVATVKRRQVKETPHGFLDRCSACDAVLSPMDVWCPRCGEKIEP